MRIEGTEGGREALPSGDQGRAVEGLSDSPGEGRYDTALESRFEGRHDGRAAPLRVDAQRNLRHVLSAARDVFGEQGYGAPMEEVARRARVGVGTVYRRFPNKEALVRYIAEEETQRLADRAREALAWDGEPWRALELFVQRSAAAGAGRLLPPELLAASMQAPCPRPHRERVPQQRRAAGAESVRAASGEQREESSFHEGVRELLGVLRQLIEHTRAAGELRADVTVADLMLVIATTPPSVGDPARQGPASSRLLKIMLQGLRASR